VDEQAATRTQLLAAIAIARIRPMSHMIEATELALRLRSQFVAEPLYQRDGVSDCRASVSSLPPRRDLDRPAHLTTSMAMPRTCLDTADAIELAEGGKTLAPLSSLWPSPMASPSTAPLPYDSLRLSDHQINGQHIGVGNWFESDLGRRICAGQSPET
jgi:hypothetical protein